MEILLAVMYAVVLVVQLAVLVNAVRRPSRNRWGALYLLEAVCILGAWLLMRWYDGLPGTGIMPGLTYFAETFFSLCAAAAYAVLLGVSILLGVVVWLRQR